LQDVPNVSANDLDIIRQYAGAFTAIGAGLLVVGLLAVISAVGIFGHRTWGRWLGILVGLVGVLVGIGGVLSANAAPTVFEGRTIDLAQNMSPSIGFLVFFAIIVLGLIIGRGHFRLKQVATKE